MICSTCVFFFPTKVETLFFVILIISFLYKYKGFNNASLSHSSVKSINYIHEPKARVRTVDISQRDNHVKTLYMKFYYRILCIMIEIYMFQNTLTPPPPKSLTTDFFVETKYNNELP